MPKIFRRVVLVTVLVVGGISSVYFSIIPYGASFFPWILASDDTEQYIKLNSEKYRIVFNDAGAAHSGNFWTWLINEGIFFDRVHTQGYSSHDVRYGKVKFPVKSINGVYYIGFCSSRRGSNRSDCKLDWTMERP